MHHEKRVCASLRRKKTGPSRFHGTGMRESYKELQMRALRCLTSKYTCIRSGAT